MAGKEIINDELVYDYTPPVEEEKDYFDIENAKKRIPEVEKKLAAIINYAYETNNKYNIIPIRYIDRKTFLTYYNILKESKEYLIFMDSDSVDSSIKCIIDDVYYSFINDATLNGKITKPEDIDGVAKEIKYLFRHYARISESTDLLKRSLRNN